MSLQEQIKGRIKVFWEQQDKFRNHPLKTELPCEHTTNLSQLAQSDVVAAVESIRNVDNIAIERIYQYLPNMEKMKADIDRVIANGNKVYISGCGASGRLAVALEYLYDYSATPENKGKVIGFLGGGDNAMIKSIEGFEDFKDFGIKQQKLAGFKDGDLLIAASASGESPFVIATAEYAAQTSVKPWFVHCNTNEALKGRIKDHVIYKDDVNVLELYTGQMALTGSTRMQATTILMLGIGLPILSKNIKAELDTFKEAVKNIKLEQLEQFVIDETSTYQNGENVYYDTEEYYGITVLTDTTERTPTFNLIPFENQLDEGRKASWCYLLFDNAKDSNDAWTRLLGRAPRTLDWDVETSRERLLGFNFSSELKDLRSKYTKVNNIYSIKKVGDKIVLDFKGNHAEFDVSGLSPILEQLVLKIVMNCASTTMMGRMGFYTGNLMTSLYPSNSKLIDRTIRYADFLLKQNHNIEMKYEDLAEAMFKELYDLKPGESIVLKTVNTLAK